MLNGIEGSDDSSWRKEGTEGGAADLGSGRPNSESMGTVMMNDDITSRNENFDAGSAK